MRNWEERCVSVGAVLKCDSVIANEAPDDEASEKCAELGEKLAE